MLYLCFFIRKFLLFFVKIIGWALLVKSHHHDDCCTFLAASRYSVRYTSDYSSYVDHACFCE